MKRHAYLVVAIDDEGVQVLQCIRAISENEAQMLFLADNDAEIIEIKKLED